MLNLPGEKYLYDWLQPGGTGELSAAGRVWGPESDNSPDSKELGGTGFPACAKNTPLFGVVKFAVIFQ